MMIEPKDLWSILPAALRRQIIDQIAAVLTETRHEIRADPADASGAQGDRLHPAVDASPGRQQPRKPPPPIRADAARQGSRLARGRRCVIDADLGLSGASA